MCSMCSMCSMGLTSWPLKSHQTTPTSNNIVKYHGISMRCTSAQHISPRVVFQFAPLTYPPPPLQLPAGRCNVACPHLAPDLGLSGRSMRPRCKQLDKRPLPVRQRRPTAAVESTLSATSTPPWLSKLCRWRSSKSSSSAHLISLITVFAGHFWLIYDPVSSNLLINCLITVSRFWWWYCLLRPSDGENLESLREANGWAWLFRASYSEPHLSMRTAAKAPGKPLQHKGRGRASDKHKVWQPLNPELPRQGLAFLRFKKLMRRARQQQLTVTGANFDSHASKWQPGSKFKAQKLVVQ